jgi:ferric-chelate reductase
MTVILRVSPTSGLGPRLLALTNSVTSSTPVLLDGPYGGLTNADLAIHESILLLAGGAGASFVTAILEDVCERIRSEENGVATKRIELHWAVRNEGKSLVFLRSPSNDESLLSRGSH